MRPTDRFRPWSKPCTPAGFLTPAPPPGPPRCPDCGRPVHRLPDGRLLTLRPLRAGWTFEPHACLPAGARYPMPAIEERPWTALDVLETFGGGD